MGMADWSILAPPMMVASNAFYGRHHCTAPASYVLSLPHRAQKKMQKQLAEQSALIRSFDYDRTYSGCVWQRTSAKSYDREMKVDQFLTQSNIDHTVNSRGWRAAKAS